jgi:large subunit ribosomal protein L18e
MVKRTGTTNIHLKGLIDMLKKQSLEQDVAIWKRIAKDLEKPTRQRRIVNLSKINRYVKENETIVVPGKVLGAGALEKKVVVAAWDFSGQAKDMIKSANGSCMTIFELMKKNPKGEKIRIMG